MLLLLFSRLSHTHHVLLMNRFLPAFPVSFQEKVQRYYRWQDAQATITGRLLLQVGLQAAGIRDKTIATFVYNMYGKPLLADYPFYFSIAHSGEWVACVLSNKATPGIDVEEIRPVDPESMREYFTAEEWHTIQQSPDKLRQLYRCWVQKEAVLKAAGTGMHGLARVTIHQQLARAEGQWYSLREIPVAPGYAACLAVPHHQAMEQVRTQFIPVQELYTRLRYLARGT